MFAVMNKCVSTMGRRLLRLWFARPVVNIVVLNNRLNSVDFFLHRPDTIKSLRYLLALLYMTDVSNAHLSYMFDPGS